MLRIKSLAMKPLELKPVRGKLAPLLLGSLAFVLMGLWLLSPYGEVMAGGSVGYSWFLKVLGGIAVLFFGACALEILRQMLDSRPRLILDDRGIFDRSLSTPVIPWSSILDAQIVQVKRSRFIALLLSDEEERYAALSPVKRMMSAANQGLGCGRFNLNITALNISAEELMAVIEEQLALRQSAPPAP